MGVDSEIEDASFLGPEAFLERVADPLVLEHVSGQTEAVLVFEASSALRPSTEMVSPASLSSHASVDVFFDSIDGFPCFFVGAVERSSSVSDGSLGSRGSLLVSASGGAEHVSSLHDETSDGTLQFLGESVPALEVLLYAPSIAMSGSVLTGVSVDGSFVGSLGFSVLLGVLFSISGLLGLSSGSLLGLSIGCFLGFSSSLLGLSSSGSLLGLSIGSLLGLSSGSFLDSSFLGFSSSGFKLCHRGRRVDTEIPILLCAFAFTSFERSETTSLFADESFCALRVIITVSLATFKSMFAFTMHIDVLKVKFLDEGRGRLSRGLGSDHGDS